MDRRVVITGMGCVTPLGHTPEQVWEGLVAGRSGVGPITLFDAQPYPVRIAAEVRGWDVSCAGLDPSAWQTFPRQTRFAVISAIEAARNAGLTPGSVDPLRQGICFGCGEVFPGFDHLVVGICGAKHKTGHALNGCTPSQSQSYPADEELLLEPGLATALAAAELDAQGPTANFTAACVSSSKAIGEAMEIIRRGEADVMFAGGAHSMVTPLGITGFYRLKTLSVRNEEPTRAARPFDRDRDGFVVGEGGAVLVLEELEHARRRGAAIVAEVSGFSCTHDAYRVTDLEPHGRSATRCMLDAIASADLTPADIGSINAHGSGTQVNDQVETIAIKAAFGSRAYEIPITSTKSMTGHLTTACGAMEVLATALTLQHQIVPPTINYETPDPQCDLDYVPNHARPMPCRHVLKNSFGFGGQNVCLVLSRWDG